MRVKKIKGTACSECGMVILKKEVEWGDYFQCGECGGLYDTREDAKSCCKGEEYAGEMY